MKLRSRKQRDRSLTFFIDWRQDGQRRRKRLVGIHDRKTAEIAFADFKVRHARGQAGLPTQENLSLRACLEAYLEIKRADVVPRHLKNLETYKTLILGHFGPDTPVMSLTAQSAASFKTAMRERGNTSSTINRRLVFLRGAIRKAIADKKISHDPLVGVENASDARPPVWRWLTHEEIAQLLEVCRNGARIKVERKNKRNYETKVAAPRGLYPLVLFLLNTGARRGEALAVRWGDVDMSRGLVRLIATKKAARGRRAEARFIPLNATLKDLFKSMERGGATDHVFHVSLNNLQRKFSRACELAKLGHVRMHDLRHTFCSHLAINATPLTVIRELAGHETMQMTLRYAHLCPSTKAAAVDGLNLGGAKESARILPVSELAG